jgi:hypothetical protein
MSFPGQSGTKKSVKHSSGPMCVCVQLRTIKPNKKSCGRRSSREVVESFCSPVDRNPGGGI